MMTLSECYAAVRKEVAEMPALQQSVCTEKDIEYAAMEMFEDQAKAQEQSARRIRAEEAVDRAYEINRER